MKKSPLLLVSCILFPIVFCAAPTRWDISDCPSNIIEASSREKTIVSRSYPTSFGNNWECTYNIQSPDNTKKILIEFTYFYLTDPQYAENDDDTFDPDAEKELVCTYQNVTLTDPKSKQNAGPYCGDEMPPMFLSDSHKLEIEALGGVIPSGMFYKGYAFKFKTVDADHRLPRQNVVDDYEDYSYGDAFYDYGRPARRQPPPPQRRPRPTRPRPTRPPARRRPPPPPRDDYYDYQSPSLMRRRPTLPAEYEAYDDYGTTEAPPGSDPDVEYGDMPPQHDNPFDVNDYDEYDYNTYEYTYRQAPPPSEKKYNERRRPPPGGSVPPRQPLPPPGPPIASVTRQPTPDVVAKKLTSSSAVKRPMFVQMDGYGGEEPYVTQEFEEDFHTPPVKYMPWEPEFYQQKALELWENPKFKLGLAIAAAVMVLIFIGLVVHCALRCTEKKLDKRNELLAMEIRKKKDETSARRKQILQLKAESEDIASTYHETFDFTEDEDDVISAVTESFMPPDNGKPVSLRKTNTDTLKRITNKKTKEKPMFKSMEAAEQPETKVVKKHAPPPPPAAVPDQGPKSLDSKDSDDEIELDKSHKIDDPTASKVTVSTVSDENSVTDQNQTVTDVSGVQSTINQSNVKMTSSMVTESVTTITDLVKSKIAMNSMSTIATEKSVKLISELESLEKKREQGDQNVESRIEDLQNQLLEFLK